MISKVPTTYGRLYIGPCPTKNVFSYWQKGEFDIIWNLGQELTEALEAEQKICNLVLHGKITDYSVPKRVGLFLSQLDLVSSVLKGGGSAFIHCKGGVGRTGMALASLLVRLEGMEPGAALEKAFNHCLGPETDEQIEFVYKVANF